MIGTKADQAAKHAASATAGFEAAKEKLGKAIQLLKEAEQEHTTLQAYHSRAAGSARASREQHERIHGRLTELLS